MFKYELDYDYEIVTELIRNKHNINVDSLESNHSNLMNKREVIKGD